MMPTERLYPTDLMVLKILYDAEQANATLTFEALYAVLCARQCVRISNTQHTRFGASLRRLAAMGAISGDGLLVRLRGKGRDLVPG